MNLHVSTFDKSEPSSECLQGKVLRSKTDPFRHLGNLKLNGEIDKGTPMDKVAKATSSDQTSDSYENTTDLSDEIVVEVSYIANIVDDESVPKVLIICPASVLFAAWQGWHGAMQGLSHDQRKK